MVCKDEVCQWFKNNEPHHRLELLCGLLNMCLPIELKFISTCVEDLGKRDFHDLRETECKANNSEEISQLSTLLDDRTRSKLVTYIALLSPTNHTCSSLLYKILVEAQQSSESPDNTLDHVKEMLLIYTMVLHHPAFTYEQKRCIGEFHGSAKSLESQLCHRKEEDQDPDLVQVLSPNYASVTDQEACDSGLSVGTETEVDTTVEGSALLPTPARLHRHFHETHKHGVVAGVSNSVTSPLVGESGESQDACSSGSGESGELYNDGETFATTYIYNSSIPVFEQQRYVTLSSDLVLTPGYQCSHSGSFHYYQYPQVLGPAPAPASAGRGAASEGSSSEDNGAGGASHSHPPVTSSPYSSPQSSPYVSPLQSLSPSRASSPWSRLNTTTTTTTTTTAAALPLVTSSTTSSVSSLSSTPSSPQLVHKVPAVVSQGNEVMQSSTSPVTTRSSTSQVHRGKPPASGSRSQKQGDRSGSRTRVSGAPVIEAGTAPANQNQNLHSPSTARSINAGCGQSKNNSSSRWPANSSSPVASSTSSSTTSSAKNLTRQSSQSPSLNCGSNPSRSPAAAVATTSSSGCKSHNVSCHEVSGVTSISPMPNSSSAIVNTRNTVSQVGGGGGGGNSQDKNVHTVSNNSGARPSASVESPSNAAHKSSTIDNSVVNNNNILNFELCKTERLNKYFRLLSSYSIEDLMRMSDRELLELGIAKSALPKVHKVLASWDSSTNHRPNGFSNSSSSSHTQSSVHSHHNHHHHIPYTSHGSSSQNNAIVTVSGSSSPSPQASVEHPSPSGTPSHTKPETSSGVTNDTQNTNSAVSSKNTQVPPQNTVQVYPLDGSGSCSKSPPLPVSCSSSQQSSVSHKTALPYSQSSTVTSSTASNTSTTVSDGEPSSPVSVISCTMPLSSPSSTNATIATTTVSLSTATTTTANITTTTNVTQCHAYTISPSQKMSVGVTAPNGTSSSSAPTIVSNQGSHVNSNTHNANHSFSTNPTLNGVPACVSPSNGVPHYMTTPPPPIHHKTPPLPPGQHRTPPPPLGPPPRTPSREPSASSTSQTYIPTSGTQHMYYANSGGSCSKGNSSLNGMSSSSTLPMNGAGYNTISGIVMSTTACSSVHALTTNISLPVYTSSGGIAVPPPSNGGLLPMVPPTGQYPQTYLYPLVSGAAPGSHTYVPPAAYATQHPQRPLYIPALGPFAHIKPAPPQSGAPIISGSSSRGSSSSSSSCSSTSSNRGFKKGLHRNGPAKLASHSSDSSPSSSQYSSPPQTPSPDHTRDTHVDKRGKAHGDIAENHNGDGMDGATHPGSGASEDGTPPPLPPQPIQIVQAPAPLPRHRYMPYQHFSAVWAPQAGMIRFPGLSLPTQGPGVAPRNPVPLNGDKSSRETTPPAGVTLPLVQPDPQCCLRSPADGCAVPTTSNGSNIHGRNGGSPLAVPPHHENTHPPPPPPPPPAHNPVPSVASAPAGQIPPGNTCAGAPHTSVQYNTAGYPMFMGTQMFQHFHGFVPSHSSALTNGFVPPSIPPNFPFQTMGGNGMNAEFMYGGQYPLMSSGTSQSGGGAAGPGCGTPSGGLAPSSTPGSGLTAASIPYPHFPPTLPHTHNPSAGAKKTCYNCGQPGHRGAECKEASIEEMCKRSTKDRMV